MCLWTDWETWQGVQVRLGRHALFTRIEPERPDTSMFVHIRPGWQEWWSWFTGLTWPASGTLPEQAGPRCLPAGPRALPQALSGVRRVGRLLVWPHIRCQEAAHARKPGCCGARSCRAGKKAGAGFCACASFGGAGSWTGVQRRAGRLRAGRVHQWEHLHVWEVWLAQAWLTPACPAQGRQAALRGVRVH